jgi:hypothetical protein
LRATVCCHKLFSPRRQARTSGVCVCVCSAASTLAGRPAGGHDGRQNRARTHTRARSPIEVEDLGRSGAANHRAAARPLGRALIIERRRQRQLLILLFRAIYVLATCANTKEEPPEGGGGEPDSRPGQTAARLESGPSIVNSSPGPHDGGGAPKRARQHSNQMNRKLLTAPDVHWDRRRLVRPSGPGSVASKGPALAHAAA